MVLVGFKPDLWRPTGLLQCFDTVGLVIWPVKIVPKITYNVLSGTLSLYTTTTTGCRWIVCCVVKECELVDPCCDVETCLLKPYATCRHGACCHNCTVSVQSLLSPCWIRCHWYCWLCVDNAINNLTQSGSPGGLKVSLARQLCTHFLCTCSNSDVM